MKFANGESGQITIWDGKSYADNPENCINWKFQDEPPVYQYGHDRTGEKEGVKTSISFRGQGAHRYKGTEDMPIVVIEERGLHLVDGVRREFNAPTMGQVVLFAHYAHEMLPDEPAVQELFAYASEQLNGPETPVTGQAA